MVEVGRFGLVGRSTCHLSAGNNMKGQQGFFVCIDGSLTE